MKFSAYRVSLFIFGISLLFMGLEFYSCSSVGRKELSPFQYSENRRDVSHEWTVDLPGVVTDLDVSRDENWILASTIPRRNGRSLRDPYLVLVNSSGQVSWKKKIDAKVKWQAISDSGKLILINSYDHRLIAFNQSGKKVWEVKNLCRPFIIEKLNRVVCYYDDEHKSHLAFTVYDFKGKTLLSIPSRGETLATQVSTRQGWTAVSKAGGKLLLADEQFKKLWEVKLPGEIVHIAFTHKGDAPVAALVNPFIYEAQTGQKLILLGAQGQILSQARLKYPAEQIQMGQDKSSGQEWIAAYGNGVKGQSLIYFDLSGNQVASLWDRFEPHYSDYSSQLYARGKQTIVGFDHVSVGGSDQRRNYLFSFNRQGKIDWSHSFQIKEKAYLYRVIQASNQKDELLVVATAESGLNGYLIESASP